MAKIIGVVQVKGGAGRSTVSTNLAGELSKKGKTILIDCDMPQGTAASWYSVRQERKPSTNLLADTAATHRELVAKVEEYSDADYIVLDGPPRIAELTRAILVLADAVLVPIGASAAEVWATTDVLELIEEAKTVKPIVARMVWTRFRAATKLAQGLSELAAKELGLAALDSTLGMRVAFVEALGDGLTVTELSDQAAKAEGIALVEETIKLLRKKK